VIAIATNTMHRVYDQVQAAVSVPLISVLDVTADAIQSRELTTVGLLGTRYTMEDRSTRMPYPGAASTC
jgi:aspartate racemase